MYILQGSQRVPADSRDFLLFERTFVNLRTRISWDGAKTRKNADSNEQAGANTATICCDNMIQAHKKWQLPHEIKPSSDL